MPANQAVQLGIQAVQLGVSHYPLLKFRWDNPKNGQDIPKYGRDMPALPRIAIYSSLATVCWLFMRGVIDIDSAQTRKLTKPGSTFCINQGSVAAGQINDS